VSYREHIITRLEEKKADYVNYKFSVIENDAFKTFFDLAQELDSIRDFYTLCVMITRTFFGLESRLYVYNIRSNSFVLAALTTGDKYEIGEPMPETITASNGTSITESGSLVLTVRGKKLPREQLPIPGDGDVLGFLEVFSPEGFDDHIKFFFEKYANRIGFNLHNRLLVIKNIEHLKFIQTLVADIEHNVIVPNMVYKLYLRRLNREILKSRDIESLLDDIVKAGACTPEEIESALGYLKEINEGLAIQEKNLAQHHKNMSLFIETLFRESHFDQGHLVLKTKKCNIKKDVIEPQLERYRERFIERGISVDDRTSFIPDEEMISVVDVGLIAQVFANLFSNALKYAREVEIEGERHKYIAYGYEVIKDIFGPGRDGVKYNVFSTGPHIAPEDREHIFEEGYRTQEAQEIRGTGHGLAFIKNVIELHKGVVGYEPTTRGNNFYIIIPR
jgi:signal transduction histidine kinase